MGRRFAFLRKPLLWALPVVCGAELILQIAAAAVWFEKRPERHVVLCAGDAYTFGAGATASEFSYPSALEKILRKNDQSWQVVNAGWPDRDSRDTLLRLPDQLLHFHPSRVYIGIGAMDAVTQPKSVPPYLAGALSHGFPLKWRTPLLWRQLLDGVGSLASKTAADYRASEHYARFRMNRPSGPSPIGTWWYQGQPVRIQDNGRISFGEIELFWEAHGDRMNTDPVVPGAVPSGQLRWERRGKLLALQGGEFPEGIVLQPVEPEQVRRLDAAAAAAFSLDRQREREKELELAIGKANPSDRFFLRSDLSPVYARDGKRGEASAELEKMRREMDAAGDPEPMVDAYIESAETIGEGTRAWAAARQFAPRYSGNALLQKTIAWEGYQNRDRESAEAAIEKALRLEGESSARAEILNLRARIFLETSPAKSLESLIEAYAISGDEAALKRRLEAGLVLYNSPLLESTLAQMKASFELRKGIRRAIDGLRGRPYDDIASVMAKHLRLMVETVRATGSEVVLMSGPLAGDGNLNDVIRRVAKEKQVGLIDLEAAFEGRLKTTPREELFAPDRHLTNKGYALVAELVANDIRKNDIPKRTR